MWIAADAVALANTREGNNMPICDEVTLEAWERAGKPGTNLVYFSGESVAHELDLAKKREDARFIDAINRIRSLYNVGQVDLVQRRTSYGTKVGEFDYIAIWRERPAKIASHEKIELAPNCEPARERN
jgi:hypothetical protein